MQINHPEQDYDDGIPCLWLPDQPGLKKLP